MKAKRILTFLMILVLLVCMLPTAYAAGSDATEQVNSDLDPALAEAGFTSDSIQASYVTVDGTASKATRGTRKYATLRNCWQMDFITNTGYHQGFHFADEDGSKPWNYMNMIYCLENKKDFSIGSGNAGSGDLTLDGTGNNHGEQIWYNLSYDQRYAVGLIILYGAPSKLWDETWGINPEGDRNYHNPNVAYRWATQALVWEITGGWREATYPYTRNSDYWYAQSTGVCMSEDGQTDYFVYAYDSIVNDLLLHNTIPSFTGDYVSTAKEIELTGSTTTVTDLNGVLYKFDFPDTDTVSYSRNGNDLTITASGPLPTEVQGATAEVPSAKASIYEVWYNQYDSSKQTCIRISIPAADPVPAYFKLKLSTGTLNIIKTATNGGTVAGWHFTITDANGVDVGQFVTDETGIITTELQQGTYTVTETDGEQEYWHNDPNPSKTIAVTAGQTTEVNFTNQWNGKIRVIKELANPESGSLDGWRFSVYNLKTGEHMGDVTTDKNGYAVLDVEPGKYRVMEYLTDSSDWQCISDIAQNITVAAGATTDVTFTNALKPSQIQVKKITPYGSLLSGVEFLLEWSTDGQSWKPVTYTASTIPQLGGCTTGGIQNGKLKTDGAGMLTFSGLHLKAYYRLTETATLDGYQLLADHVYEGTLGSDRTLEFTVVNEPVFTLPQTGSKSLALMPVGLLVCMAVCMGALFILRKKER